MAHAISSENFIACCLILAAGDVNINTEQVILNAECYQKREDRHFGVEDTDFRMAFVWFGLTERFFTFMEIDHMEIVLRAIPLIRWIEPMLSYAEVSLTMKASIGCDMRNSVQPCQSKIGR
ncbi:MAG: hypothetical protein ACYC27_16485 [Armatimonadota bacterium]